MALDCCTRYCCWSKKGKCSGERWSEPAVGLGLIFHFVSLVESTILSRPPVAGLDPLLGVAFAGLSLAMVVVFFVFFVGYRTTSPWHRYLPDCFRPDLCFTAVGQHPVTADPRPCCGNRLDLCTRGADLYRLCRTSSSALAPACLYLAQERALKSKKQDGVADLAHASPDH